MRLPPQFDLNACLTLLLVSTEGHADAARYAVVYRKVHGLLDAAFSSMRALLPAQTFPPLSDELTYPPATRVREYCNEMWSHLLDGNPGLLGYARDELHRSLTDTLDTLLWYLAYAESDLQMVEQVLRFSEVIGELTTIDEDLDSDPTYPLGMIRAQWVFPGRHPRSKGFTLYLFRPPFETGTEPRIAAGREGEWGKLYETPAKDLSSERLRELVRSLS